MLILKITNRQLTLKSGLFFIYFCSIMKKSSVSKKVLAPVKHGANKMNVPSKNTMPQPKNPYTKATGFGLKSCK